jgi:Putative adhesin
MNRTVLSVFALAAIAAGCSHAGSEEHAWEWTSQIAPGSIVHIRNGAGDITVRPSTTGRLATVTGGRTWKRSRGRDVDFVVTQEGNQYYVCAMWRGSGNCGASGYRGRRSGGILEAFALFHRSSDATASFVAQLPADVFVDAQTTTGSVDVEGVSSGVRARSTNGAVSAAHVSGPMTLTTVNGNVRLSVDAVSANDSINLRTTNGKITAELPPNIDGVFDLAVTNGVVRTDLPINGDRAERAGRRVRGQIGTSSRVVRMRTTNGTLSVTTKAVSTSN